MRLKLLLVSDKADYSPEIILMIKNDVTHAISKYMEIEKDRARIRMSTEGDPKKGGCWTLSMLHVNISIRSISDKRLY